MEYKEHCKECKEEFGDTFERVHKFLDSFAAEFGWDHRRILHHKYGIEIVRCFFGESGAKAAELHIKNDCNGEIPEVEDWLDVNYWLNLGPKNENSN